MGGSDPQEISLATSRPPGVCFIVPAFQAAATLPASLAAIRASAPPGSHVVVVDDGSLDNTNGQAHQLADQVVTRPCQGGAARARNDGAQRATGDVLFFVDADVTVTPEAVAGALRQLASADAVFGAYQALPPPAVANAATTAKNLLHHYTHRCSAGEVSTFWSGFGAVRREAFLAVGGFDPAVTSGADVEDIHLGYRLRRAGYRIVLDPSLQVAHHKRYTVRGVISSDIFHRAIPWARAMLQERTFRTDLNLRKSALSSAVLANGAVLSGLAALVVGPRSLLVSLALVALWLAFNLRYLNYVRRQWSLMGAAASAALLFLYFLYGPIGTAAGFALHILRRRDDPPWLDTAPLSGSTPQALAATVAVVLLPEEELPALDALAPPARWWELLVVAERPPDGMPAGARFVGAPPGSSRAEMRQLALDAARGEMFAPLDVSMVPAAGWLDRVVDASAGRHLMVGGSFSPVRSSGAARASQILRFWPWRSGGTARWLVDHPPANAAYRTVAARSLGGVADDGLSHRLVGFGARPVRFDPAMAVVITAPVTVRRFLGETARASRSWVGATVRARRAPALVRLALVPCAPALALAGLARRITGSVRDGTADAGFWATVPLIALGYLAALGGSLLGLVRPSASPLPEPVPAPPWLSARGFPRHAAADETARV